MKKILIFASIILTFTCCNSTQYLQEPGTYTIKRKEGDMTQFLEAKETYAIFSDTLKKNDKIIKNVVKAKPPRKTTRQKMI